MDSLNTTCSLILQPTALHYDVDSKAFCGFRVLACPVLVSTLK